MMSSSGGARSTRRTSGSRCGRRMSRESHKRTARPGRVRPARPARCSAESAAIRSTTRWSTAVSGSNRSTLCTPESTTSVTPSTVSEVSAMFVARITLRRSAGASARSCASTSSEPCSGRTSASTLASSPRVRSISRSPGRKQRMSPSASRNCSRMAVVIETSGLY